MIVPNCSVVCKTQLATRNLQLSLKITFHLLQSLAVRKRIAYAFAHHQIAVVYRLVGDELHLFHIRLAIFAR